jgi:hypothetical protein
MSKQQPDWSWFNPLATLQESFKKQTEKYNVTLQTQKKLDERLLLQQNEGILVGVKQNLTNRYQGMKELKTLPQRAKEGFLWASFFLFTPQIILEQSVENATKVWAWQKIKGTGHNPIEFISNFTQGVVTGVVTTTMTERRDIERIVSTSQSIVEHRVKNMVAGTIFSFGVSMFLKQMAQRSQSEIARHLLKNTRRTWQISGFVAVAYGLGCLRDAMEDPELNGFTQPLKIDRDQAWEENKSNWKEFWRKCLPSGNEQEKLFRLIKD